MQLGIYRKNLDCERSLCLAKNARYHRVKIYFDTKPQGAYKKDRLPMDITEIGSYQKKTRKIRFVFVDEHLRI